VERGDQG